jgi:hypothetical protein
MCRSVTADPCFVASVSCLFTICVDHPLTPLSLSPRQPPLFLTALIAATQGLGSPAVPPPPPPAPLAAAPCLAPPLLPALPAAASSAPLNLLRGAAACGDWGPALRQVLQVHPGRWGQHSRRRWGSRPMARCSRCRS